MDRDFTSLIKGPSAKRTGHKSKRKKQGSITYCTDQEDEASKIFIIVQYLYYVLDRFWSDFYSHVMV